MGKDRLYFLTFISICIVFIFTALIGVNYSVKISINLLLESEIKSAEIEVHKIHEILSRQTTVFEDKKLQDDMQDLLEVVASGKSYMAILDSENKIIYHPKINNVSENSLISTQIQNAVNKGLKISAIYNVLMSYKKDLYENNEINILEILYEKPIENSSFKIVSLLNIDNLLLNISKLERRLHTIFILMGFLIIIISFFAVRFIGSFYEKKLESKAIDLENDIISITKLNLDLLMYQQKNEKKTIEKQETTPLKKEAVTASNSNNNKLRILSYKGDEIIPIPLNNIAYIYTENTITYIVDDSEKKSFSNASLDEIYGDLDDRIFFRANRQFIIHIAKIEKIIKYGKSQLKIVIINSDVEILIRKNKVAKFKQWLNI